MYLGTKFLDSQRRTLNLQNRLKYGLGPLNLIYGSIHFFRTVAALVEKSMKIAAFKECYISFLRVVGEGAL